VKVDPSIVAVRDENDPESPEDKMDDVTKVQSAKVLRKMPKLEGLSDFPLASDEVFGVQFMRLWH